MKYLIILITTLLITGCRSGGGGGGVLGSLFDSGASSGSSFASGASSGSGANIPLAHTPEPSTMILLGVGLAGLAAAALRKKKDNSR